MKVSIAVAMLILVSASNPALAYCSEPTAPDPPASYGRPDVPFCLSGYSYTGRHDCDQWEIDQYVSEVEDFQRKLKEYLEEVDAFTDDAVDYAKCEMNEVIDESGIFE